MRRDPLDELQEHLFDAGRDELPSAAALDRMAATVRWNANDRDARWTSCRPVRLATWAAVGALGLAAVLWLWPAGDPLYITADRQQVSIRSRSEPQPEKEPSRVESTQPAKPPSSAHVAHPRTGVQNPPATLADEVEALRRAREALTSGQPAQALQEIERYDTILRGHRLRADAELIRIEALAASGRREQARRTAERYVMEHANHPLVDRARAFLFETTDPDEPLGSPGNEPE